MKNTQKDYVIISLLIIIIVLLLGGYYFIQKSNSEIKNDEIKQGETTRSETPAEQVTQVTPQASPTQVRTITNQNSENTKPVIMNTQLYNGNKFSFEYPSILSLKEDNGTITISHSVKFTHYNPCDMKGTLPALSALTDFKATIKVVDLSIGEYLKAMGWPQADYVYKNPFTFETMKGYRVISGVEGCGETLYYFSINPNKTVVMTHSLIAEFSTINSDYKKILTIPGVIVPNKDEEYFLEILSTLKVK